jgi:predicted HTH transcriptional regulator
MQKENFKKQELMQVLQEGEGQFVEFKEKVDNSLTKEIVAFANASGGRIFIGVDDSGKVKGASIYIKERVPVRFEIKAARRVEHPQFHEDAYREAIVNAVVHRDYFENGEVAVEKFENMIVVNNPGGLVASFPIYEFGKLSWPRNRLLADLLSKTIFMEKVGTGIKRMERFCNEIGNTIDIKPLSTHFFVEMESPKKLLPDNGLKNSKKDGIKLNKSQERIINLVMEDKNITHESLAEKVGISIRNVEKRIADLKQKRILIRIGSRKSGCWEIDRESLKSITGDGIKDGENDGLKDGIKNGF